MTDAVSAFPFILAPNGSSLSPQIETCDLPESRVSQILLTFPPGCSGLVGVQVRYANNPVYPIGGSSFFVLDDYTIVIPVSNQRTGGQWSLAGYNTDVYQHAVRAYFYFDYVDVAAAAPPSGLISL